MKNFEYITTEIDEDKLTEGLNKKGKDGWQAVKINKSYPDKYQWSHNVLLMREIEDFGVDAMKSEKEILEALEDFKILLKERTIEFENLDQITMNSTYGKNTYIYLQKLKGKIEVLEWVLLK